MEQRIDLTHFSERIAQLKAEIAAIIVGQEQTVDLVLTTILADGHALIEGVPGVAKTLLAKLTAPPYLICSVASSISIGGLSSPISCLSMKSIVLLPKPRLLSLR